MIVCVSSAGFLLLMAGCMGESDTVIRKKLEIIVEDDLASVINELPAASRSDSSYYNIVEFEKYKEGKYSRRAVVDFYFLKKVNVKMVRKYRYHSEYRKWERYYNQYEFLQKKK